MKQSPQFLGVGWSYPPQVDEVTGRFVMCSGEEDIRQSIRIILETRLNERAMTPDFGSRLTDFVFDLPDAATTALLRDDLISSIVRWEPRVIDTDVGIDTTKIFNGQILLTISYTVRATNNPGNLVYPYYLDEGIGAGQA